MRILFIGTADIGTGCLESLAALPEHQLVGVVTQPDRPVGRRQELTPPPIKTLALKHNIPVFQPEKIRKPEALAEIRALAPELIVVIAYGQILPGELLTMPRLGCVNVHASLLPRWRGASPIQAALLAGDSETGITTMLMDEGLDTGPMLLRESLRIEPEDDAGALHDKLGRLGAQVLLRTIAGLVAGTLKPQPQPESGVTYAAKIKKEDGLVDWHLSAQQLHNRLRAFSPWPGLFTHLADSTGRKMLKIWKAKPESALTPAASPGTVLQAGPDRIVIGCGEGVLAVSELQLEGSRRLTAGDFLRGRALAVGTILG